MPDFEPVVSDKRPGEPAAGGIHALEGVGLPGAARAGAIIGAGAASGFLYLSVVLSLLFLIPVQVVFGRHGRKAGMAAAGVALAVTLLGRAAWLAGEGFLSLGALAFGLLVPAALLGALALVNAPFWGALSAPWRALAAAGALALAAAPALAGAWADPAFNDYLVGRIASLVEPFKAQLGAATGGGFDASALAASLDPASLAAASKDALASCYAAILLALVGGSWWLGSRLAGPGSRGRVEAPALSACRLPYALVWPFLASWALVLAALLGGFPVAVRHAAWNLAISLSLLYAAQGLGIASHFAQRINMPRPLRIAIAASALLALATPTAGVAVGVVLPLLGVTEVWIPYRNPKGVGA